MRVLLAVSRLLLTHRAGLKLQSCARSSPAPAQTSRNKLSHFWVVMAAAPELPEAFSLSHGVATTDGPNPMLRVLSRA